MDVSVTYPAGADYHGPAPIIVAASSASAMSRARSFIDHQGIRIGAAVALGEARERIAEQARASAVWIEIDEDRDGLDLLLNQVARDAADGRYPAIVATTADILDPVIAGLGEAPVDVLVDANFAERTAALAVATSTARLPLRIADVSADRSAEQLRHLSDEVNRIATMLARLSSGPGDPPRAIEPSMTGDAPDVPVETVRRVIRARRLRARYFPEQLFADPAWDMLLDLLQAELSHLRVPVSSLCIAASVPATTALRWLKTMVAEGLFVRRADPHDGRRVFVELAPDASIAMRRYFAELGPVAVAV